MEGGEGSFRFFPSLEKIRVLEADNVLHLGKLACLKFLEWAHKNPKGVVALPTGKSPEMFMKYLEFYRDHWTTEAVQDELKSLQLEGCASFPDTSGLTFVQLDEFFPLLPSHKNSFTSYVRRLYLPLLKIPEERFITFDFTDPSKNLLDASRQTPLLEDSDYVETFPNGIADLSLLDRTATDEQERKQQKVLLKVSEFCEAYEEEVRRLGGIGFFMGGIGPDGHVAFNLAGSRHDSRTRLVALNYPSAAQAAGDLGGIEYSRGKAAVTIGLSTITYRKDATVLIIAAGEGKAPMVSDALTAPTSEAVPASALRVLEGARFLVSRGAAKLLPHRRAEHLRAERGKLKLEGVEGREREMDAAKEKERRSRLVEIGDEAVVSACRAVGRSAAGGLVSGAALSSSGENGGQGDAAAFVSLFGVPAAEETGEPCASAQGGGGSTAKGQGEGGEQWSAVKTKGRSASADSLSLSADSGVNSLTLRRESPTVFSSSSSAVVATDRRGQTGEREGVCASRVEKERERGGSSVKGQQNGPSSTASRCGRTPLTLRPVVPPSTAVPSTRANSVVPSPGRQTLAPPFTLREEGEADLEEEGGQGEREEVGRSELVEQKMLGMEGVLRSLSERVGEVEKNPVGRLLFDREEGGERAGLVEESAEACRQRLIHKVARGLRIVRGEPAWGIDSRYSFPPTASSRDMPGPLKILHTGPHHDDVELSYHAVLSQMLDKKSAAAGKVEHYFAYATSGFHSVTDLHLLTCLERAGGTDRDRLKAFMNKWRFALVEADYASVLDEFSSAFSSEDEEGMLEVDSVLLMRAVDRVLLREEASEGSAAKGVDAETHLERLEAAVISLCSEGAEKSLRGRRPGDACPLWLQKLKGFLRETETDRYWYCMGVHPDRISHLRSKFYTDDFFTPLPTLEDDCMPLVRILREMRPDVISLAFDPEGTGPDTHFKVLQLISAAVRILLEEDEAAGKGGEWKVHIWGYRNVWFRFDPWDANLIFPVSRDSLDEGHRLFVSSFRTQAAASFPSPLFDGPFSLWAAAIQEAQRAELLRLIGSSRERESVGEEERSVVAALEKSEAAVLLKEMTPAELIAGARDLRSRLQIA